MTGLTPRPERCSFSSQPSWAVSSWTRKATWWTVPAPCSPGRRVPEPSAFLADQPVAHLRRDEVARESLGRLGKGDGVEAAQRMLRRDGRLRPLHGRRQRAGRRDNLEDEAVGIAEFQKTLVEPAQRAANHHLVLLEPTLPPTERGLARPECRRDRHAGPQASIGHAHPRE